MGIEQPGVGIRQVSNDRANGRIEQLLQPYY